MLKVKIKVKYKNKVVRMLHNYPSYKKSNSKIYDI